MKGVLRFVPIFILAFQLCSKGENNFVPTAPEDMTEFERSMVLFLKDSLSSVPGFDVSRLFYGMVGAMRSPPSLLPKVFLSEEEASCPLGGKMSMLIRGTLSEILTTTKYVDCAVPDELCKGTYVFNQSSTSYVKTCSEGYPCFEGEIEIYSITEYQKDGVTSIKISLSASLESITFVIYFKSLTEYEMRAQVEGVDFEVSLPSSYAKGYVTFATAVIDYTALDMKGSFVSEFEAEHRFFGTLNLIFGSKSTGKCIYAKKLNVKTEEPVRIYVKAKDKFLFEDFKIQSGKLKIGRRIYVTLGEGEIKIWLGDKLVETIKISGSCAEGKAFVCE